jgi:hypothetical protein
VSDDPKKRQDIRGALVAWLILVMLGFIVGGALSWYITH